MDFSENYTFTQDEIQSAYWATNSCTIFTTMVYINYERELLSIPIVVVSNYMQQDKYAVATFTEAVIENIRKSYLKFNMENVIYQSDNTGKHFKQKFSFFLGKIIYEKFQWHFTVTSHCKSAIDGLGDPIKRRVREATRSRKIDLQTAQKFVDCAKQLCPKNKCFMSHKKL